MLVEVKNQIQFDLLSELRRKSRKRDELVQILGYPRTTIYDNLLKLMKRNLVKTSKFSTGKKGRPNIYFYATLEPNDIIKFMEIKEEFCW